MKLYSLLILTKNTNKSKKQQIKSTKKVNMSECIIQHFLADGINIWPNAVLTFNHPLDVHIVCLGFSWILINLDKKCFLKCENFEENMKS